MNHINVDLNVAPFRQVVHEYSGYQSLTDVPKAIVFNDPFLQVKVSPAYTHVKEMNWIK